MNRPYFRSRLLLMGLIVTGYSHFSTASPEKNKNTTTISGTMEINVSKTNEILHKHLLPLSPVVIENSSDTVLYDFINKKIKWEK
jgi:hypothetical protein